MEKTMRMIYICQPYRAKDEAIRQRNIEYAKQLTREVLLQEMCPIATHLYMTQCLDDAIKQERKIGLAAGQEILKKCDAIYVGTKYGISAGMKKEMEQAKKIGITILFDKIME